MKETHEKTKKILRIALIVLAVFLAEEFVRTMLVGMNLLPVPMPYYDDVECYKDESYKDLRRGKEASQYLPEYDEIDHAERIEFLYVDQTLGETIFVNYSHVIAVAAEYDEDAYKAEKEKLLQQGTEMGNVYEFSQTRLVETVRKGIKRRTYYLTLLSDEYNTVIYVVYYDDVPLDSIYTLFFDSVPFDYFSSHFFKPRK